MTYGRPGQISRRVACIILNAWRSSSVAGLAVFFASSSLPYRIAIPSVVQMSVGGTGSGLLATAMAAPPSKSRIDPTSAVFMPLSVGVPLQDRQGARPFSGVIHG